MKNKYTLTWKRPGTWRKNGICRENFDWTGDHWRVFWDKTPIHAFCYLITILEREPQYNFFGDKNFRLSCSGRLVARQATYKGV